MEKVIVIGGVSNATSGVTRVENVSSALEAIAGNTAAHFIFMDGRLNADDQRTAREALAAAKSADFAYISSDDSIEISSSASADLVNIISSNGTWPLSAVKVKAEFCKDFPASADSFHAAMAILAIRAIAKESSICAIEAKGLQATKFAQSISKTAATRCLSEAIECCNIEELFPKYAWSTHQAESAAACYHNLAAAFIKLGDTDSALEALALGDSLEDSPRSLALKAIIAKIKGETLEAIANIISSLQQYELRKRNEDKTHYLSFVPSDLGLIDRKMRLGLHAINNRDNSTALACFSEAVANFDSFYQDWGIQAKLLQ